MSRLLCSPPMDALAVVSDGLGIGRPSAVRSLFPVDRCPGEESLDHGEVVFHSFAERAHCSPQGLRRSTVPPGARGGPVAPHPRQHWGSLVF